MKGFQLIATGGALPGRTVTNEELSKVRICGTYHTITQKRLLLKLPTGISVYQQKK